MSFGRSFLQSRFSSRLHKPKFRPKPIYREEKTNFKGEILYGIYPVKLALEVNQRNFYTVFYNPASKRVGEIVEAATRSNVNCEALSPAMLDGLSRQSTKDVGVHQGVCADVSRLIVPSVDDVPEAEREETMNLWVLACSIGDPHNLGAILRSSYYLGVRGVITCDVDFNTKVPKATSLLSPVVSKASSGVLEVYRPFHVQDPLSFVKKKSLQGWDIIGSGNSRKRQRIEGETLAAKTPNNKLLIVGNEGYGIPEVLEQFCNSHLDIHPGRRLHPYVDSLNVSVATALLIQSIRGNELDGKGVALQLE